MERIVAKEKLCDEGKKRCYDFGMGNGERITQLGDFRKESADMLSELLADLEKHNKENNPSSSWGKILGRALTSRIEKDTGDDEIDINTAGANVTIETAQSARTELAALKTKYEKVLSRFGLTLSHQASEGLKHGLPSGPISMKIENIHSFLRYAQSIPAQNEQSNSPEVLKTLLNVIETQIASTNFQHSSPEEKSLLENIEALHDAFKRIAPGLDVSRLQNFVNFKERVEQYLAVERAGLWTQPGKGFGPADWVRDTTPENLDSRWAGALKALREQEVLGDVGVVKELQEHLQMCLTKAKERLPSLSRPEETREKLQQILEKYEVELKN